MSRTRLLKLEPWLFLVFAAFCTLLSARSFFDARQSALQFAEAARHASPPDSAARLVPPVRWSAPLDDVFIHFDFARSLAQGKFFEWAPGGGYSSGATSWLYPAILAIAYRLGLRGFALGHFTDWFSCLCVFGGLWALGRAYQGLSRLIPYVITAALMSLGVFDWALWSGMELPLFLQFGVVDKPYTEVSNVGMRHDHSGRCCGYLVFWACCSMLRGQRRCCAW